MTDFCLIVAISLGFGILAFESAYYIWLLPSPQDEPISPSWFDLCIGNSLYWLSHALTLLRLPLAILPYCAKLAFSLILRRPYKILEQGYSKQGLHIVGDCINWMATLVLVRYFELGSIFYVPVVAELIRLLTERGQLVVSGLWMHLPHRTFSKYLGTSDMFPGRVFALRILRRYCAYYGQTDDERLAYVEAALRRRTATNPDLVLKLSYFHSFRVRPACEPLRAGLVRDVAGGDILVSPLWTSDPWLLMALAVRRAPWMFDPRIVARPFYYRTCSARLATRVVLMNARHFPTFAVYQFGHETKDARYAYFYALLHRMGVHIEEFVSFDGTYQQDHFLRWIERRFGRGGPVRQPLWSDDAVLAAVADRIDQGEIVEPITIAGDYTYPISYVLDVLWPRISRSAVEPP